MNTYEYALIFIPPLYPRGNDYLKFCIFHALAFKIKMVFIHVQVIYYLFLSFIFKKHHIVYNLLKIDLLKKNQHSISVNAHSLIHLALFDIFTFV